MPSVFSSLAQLKKYSWGALLGLCAGALILWLSPSLREQVWPDAPVVIGAVAAGILLERGLRHWVGRFVDPWLHHLQVEADARRKHEELEHIARLRHEETELAARYRHEESRAEADRQLTKLADYEKRGVLTHGDVTVMAARAARRDVLGGSKPGKLRGQYKKEPGKPPATTGGAAPPLIP